MTAFLAYYCTDTVQNHCCPCPDAYGILSKRGHDVSRLLSYARLSWMTDDILLPLPVHARWAMPISEPVGNAGGKNDIVMAWACLCRKPP